MVASINTEYVDFKASIITVTENIIETEIDTQFAQTAFVASDEQIIPLGTYTDSSSDITIF